ncbi:serine protease inhibitor Kazal-type 1-like [Pimephales promelas]|uniref:serine protease inhibitor Kazal-type 1-like n=1 Tax=Pimephales promelas TaxID=90988 RepID=UPI0019559B8F|nr:serine protease inhibitor Kazal-type 1-like [Pimephales promelas]KAG1935563.1 trypsin inhibitor ClTI-1-like [Pimephales promelas]
MFARGIIVLLCVLVAISDGARMANCRHSSNMCTMQYSPVCGSNGITYGNECMMCGAIKASGTQILVQKIGPCGETQEWQQA